jgi:uncharacterized protein (TIGR02466 family)
VTLLPINPFPPIVFHDHFKFSDEHRAAAYEMLHAATESITDLEEGDAQSTVGDQNNTPHRHPAFLDFFSWLEEKSNNIVEQWKLDATNNFYVGNSWINRHGVNGATIPHNHGFSLISCVAYISLPQGSGFTQFKDPHYDFKNLHETSSSLQEYYSVPVKQGDILFFPGWLTHRSEKSNSIEDRLVLSANFVNFTHTKFFTLGNIQL